MYPTIILGIAILLSVLTVINHIGMILFHIANNHRKYTSNLGTIGLSILAIIFWCWFYYLTH